MNEQHFDKLFQKKLVDYSQMPSEEALKKLDTRIKRRHRGVVMQFSRVAATLLLIAASIYLIDNWNQQTTEKVAVISTEVTPAISPSSPNLVDSIATNIEVETADTEAKDKLVQIPLNTREPKNGGVLNSVPSSTTRKPQQQTKKIIDEINSQTNGLLAEESVNSQPSDQTVTLKQEPVRQKVTITYKRSFASPNPELASNEQNQRKNKGFKGFWKAAVQVDQNISLAGIRATKDELLAINRRGKSKETKPD